MGGVRYRMGGVRYRVGGAGYIVGKAGYRGYRVSVGLDSTEYTKTTKNLPEWTLREADTLPRADKALVMD